MNEPLLTVRGLTKYFLKFRAVGDVSFDLAAGEALGIIGPNGSGKTTLVNLITGFLRPNSGRVIFKGRDITGRPAHRVAQSGLVRTFQMARPFHRLLAAENVIVPLTSRRLDRLPGGRYGGRLVVAIDLLEEVGFERDSLTPFKPAGALPHGHLKKLELARCLALRPELIVLDEIFSGLSLAEVSGLRPVIERLRREGVSLIMIEHRLRELFQVVDRVVAMNFGEIVAAGNPREVMADPRVAEAYIGAE